MFETPMPEIPKDLWDEKTIDMYWEVGFVGYPRNSYRVRLMRKVEYIKPAWVRTWDETNPKKRWWNSQPEYVKKSEEFPEELIKDDREVMSRFLSEDLDFTAEEVYEEAMSILRKLETNRKTKKLLGTYPPKTLDIDPEGL